MSAVSLRRLVAIAVFEGRQQSGRRAFILSSLSTHKKYSDTGVFAYSREQIFEVVADVDKYHEFVPLCVGSTVFDSTRKTQEMSRGQGICERFEAELVVGYLPFRERYTSLVRLERPWRIVAKAVPNNGIFKHMRTVWELSPSSGSAGTDAPQSPFLRKRPETLVTFIIEFEFNSILHAHAASAAFEKIAKTTLSAYRARCQKLYG
ncbi:Coenzyme Q-binding protein coq10a, mitochondrial, partial [Coemansia erecta]